MSDQDPSTWTVRKGQDVLGSDGEKVGDVESSSATHIVVRRGILFAAKEIHVPIDAIRTIDEDYVHLFATMDEALGSGWDTPPENAPDSGDARFVDGASEIHEGMDVVGADGEKIGEIDTTSNDTLTIQTGFLFHKTYTVNTSDVADVRDGKVHLSLTKEDLEESAEEATADDAVFSTSSETADGAAVGPAAGAAALHDKLSNVDRNAPEVNVKPSDFDDSAPEARSRLDGIKGKIGGNAVSRRLADAGEIVSRQTRPDATIAGNARSGSLAGAREHVTQWTSNESSQTESAAARALAGKEPTIAGATQFTSKNEAADSSSGAGDRDAKVHGPDDSEGTDWVAAQRGATPPDGWLVKGIVDSGIYHTPESASYEATIADVWFTNAEAAERAGYRSSKNPQHPGEDGADSTICGDEQAEDKPNDE